MRRQNSDLSPQRSEFCRPPPPLRRTPTPSAAPPNEQSPRIGLALAERRRGGVIERTFVQEPPPAASAADAHALSGASATDAHAQRRRPTSKRLESGWRSPSGAAAEFLNERSFRNSPAASAADAHALSGAAPRANAANRAPEASAIAGRDTNRSMRRQNSDLSPQRSEFCRPPPPLRPTPTPSAAQLHEQTPRIARPPQAGLLNERSFSNSSPPRRPTPPAPAAPPPNKRRESHESQRLPVSDGARRHLTPPSRAPASPNTRG